MMAVDLGYESGTSSSMDQDTFDADVEDDSLMSVISPTKAPRALRPRMSRTKSNVSISSFEDETERPSFTPRKTKSSAAKKSRDKGKQPSSSVKPPTDMGPIKEALARTLQTCEWDDKLLILGTKELNSFLKQADFSKDQISRLKVARRRAKNRTYALRSRQKKSGKLQSPCPGPSPAPITAPLTAAAAAAVATGKTKVTPTSPAVMKKTSGKSTKSGGRSKAARIAAHALQQADDESASEYEYGQPMPGSAFFDDDDEMSSILSSDHNDTDDSSLFDGFTSSDQFNTDEYDSSLDLLSSSLDSTHNPTAFDNAAFADAAFESFEALTLNTAEPTADYGDNFLRCMFANNSSAPPGAAPQVNGGSRVSSGHDTMPATTLPPQGPPASGLMTDLDAMMADLRENYSAVHAKLDTVASVLGTNGGAGTAAVRAAQSIGADKVMAGTGKHDVSVGAAGATSASPARRRRSRSTTPTPADNAMVQLPANLDVADTLRELKSGFNSLTSKIDAWSAQASMPLSPQFASPSYLSPELGLGRTFTFDSMDVDTETH